MAPLSTLNTARLALDYNTCGEDHTVLMRYSGAGSAGECMAILHTMLDSMAAFLFEVTIIGARNYPVGVNFSTPITWTGDPTYGGDPGPHYASAQYVDFVGRSAGGRRVRVAFFGAQTATDGGGEDFRFQAADFPFVVTCVTALASNAGNAVAIDGLDATWHLYGNGGVNAYWRNKIR